MPRTAPARAAALPISASMSRPVTGRTWIVTSRARCDCQSPAAARNSMTAPIVIEARKVMMAMTAIRACPTIVAFGTIDASKRGSGTSAALPTCSPGSGASAPMPVSIIDMQPTWGQHEPAGVVLIHQRDIVRGEQHRGARFVELDEQTQQALRVIGIDIAGRLVGEQQLGPRDHGARDRGALFLAAGKNRWQRPHAIAETDPVQELHHLLAKALLGPPHDPERQRDALVGGHGVERRKVLNHGADAAPHCRRPVLPTV